MGPLHGITALEIRGIGPGPYAGMLLADLGAEVIVVERVSGPSGIAPPARSDSTMRGKKSIALNLKLPEGIATLLSLVERVDVLFEGFRPGVAERVGFGPDECLAKNPRLVYGRVTGWGQYGPLSNAAGHDINYIALTGALAAIGGSDKPVPPLNIVGDYAGGSLFLVVGILAALLEVQRSGKGQVIDAAITDGSASLMSLFHTLGATGDWSPSRQSNLLDGAAHFYDVYKTSDAKYVSIGSIEPQFYKLLIEKAGLDDAQFAAQYDELAWPELKQKLQSVMATKSRDEWCSIMEGTDVCFAPVLDYEEAPGHHHNQARQTYIDIDGLTQPAPAPRFSRTAPGTPTAPRAEGSDTREILLRYGFEESELVALQNCGAIDPEAYR